MLVKLGIWAALVAMLTFPSGAGAQFYGAGPWCAVVNTGTGNVQWDCSYASLEHCQPNVIAGNGGFCNLNPSYASAGSVYGPNCRITVRRVWRHGHPVAIRRRACW